MIEIYSNFDKKLLIHKIIKAADFKEYDELNEKKVHRVDELDVSNPLQVASMTIKNGMSFQAHRHLPCERIERTISEVWIVFEGIIRVTYYDIIGNEPIAIYDLCKGDTTISMNGGGHSYTTIADAKVLELKAPHYEGKELDKTPIED